MIINYLLCPCIGLFVTPAPAPFSGAVVSALCCFSSLLFVVIIMDFGVSFFGDGSSPGFTSGRPLTPPFPSSSYSQASVVQNLRKFTPPDDKQFRELQIKNSHYQNETRNILRMIQAREKERREAPLTVYVPPRRFPQIFEALNYPEEQRYVTSSKN